MGTLQMKSMHKFYFLLFWGFSSLCWGQEIAMEQTFPRPVSPFKSYISAVGIVEAGSENIFIGTPLQRIVNKVKVSVGSEIHKGDILLELEHEDLNAELNIKQVAHQIALAKFKLLEALPRPEDIQFAEGELQAAQVELSQAKSLYSMVQGLQDTRALSLEKIEQRSFNYQAAEAKVRQAQARLEKIRNGTWKPDLDIAWLEVQQAKANIERINADINRTIIRSPINGKVLQIKIHEGEFPPFDTSRTPMLVLGNTDEKLLQVSINQFNAPYFRPEASAVAYLQGNAQLEFPLEFVHLEPYLVNKTNLTNDIIERVDTRVLQVEYRLKKDYPYLYVGQQMDVFVEADYNL